MALCAAAQARRIFAKRSSSLEPFQGAPPKFQRFYQAFQQYVDIMNDNITFDCPGGTLRQ
jgi:hypothetical protein